MSDLQTSIPQSIAVYIDKVKVTAANASSCHVKVTDDRAYIYGANETRRKKGEITTI